MRHAVLAILTGALLSVGCGTDGTLEPLPRDLPSPAMSVILPDVPTFSADTVGTFTMGGVNPHPTFSGLDIRESDGAFTVGGAAVWAPTGRPTLGTVLAFAPDLTLLETVEFAPPPIPGGTLLLTQHAWADDGSLLAPLSNQFSMGVAAPDGTITFESSSTTGPGGAAPFCNPVQVVPLPNGNHLTFDFCTKNYYERASDGTYTLFADLPPTFNGLRWVALDDDRLLVSNGTALYTVDRGQTSATQVLDLSGVISTRDWGQLRVAPADGPLWDAGDIVHPTRTGFAVVEGDFSGLEVYDGGFTRTLNADFDAGGTLYLQDVFTDHLIRIGSLSSDALLNSLRGAIEALREGGVLNNGQANALLSKLDNAEKKLDQDKTGPAINVLEALINQVEALVNGGILTQEHGDHLIQLTQQLIGIL